MLYMLYMLYMQVSLLYMLSLHIATVARNLVAVPVL